MRKYCLCGCGLQIQPQRKHHGPVKRFLDSKHKKRYYSSQASGQEEDTPARFPAYHACMQLWFVHDCQVYQIGQCSEEIFQAWFRRVLLRLESLDGLDLESEYTDKDEQLLLRWYSLLIVWSDVQSLLFQSEENARSAIFDSAAGQERALLSRGVNPVDLILPCQNRTTRRNRGYAENHDCHSYNKYAAC